MNNIPHIVDTGASFIKMNAYELADAIDTYLDSILYDAIHPIEDELNKSITMLRQQADRIADLETTLAFKQAKPLSDEEIIKIYKGLCDKNDYGCLDFAKAIEERHGIK